MSGIKHHAWEDDGAHDWERGSNSDDGVDPSQNKELAAELFLDTVVGLYLTSSISAEALCTICYWGHLAGLPDSVGEYGKKPGGASGNYQKKLDRVLGLRDKKSKVKRRH